MNDRLSELRAAACLYARDKYPKDIVNFGLCMAEKLAELVVIECAEYANWYQANSQYTDIAKAIKEHFGVEE